MQVAVKINGEQYEVNSCVAEMIAKLLNEREIIEQADKGHIILHYKRQAEVKVEHTYHK